VKFLISTAYAQNLGITSQHKGGHDVVVAPRSSDWGKRGTRKYLHHVLEGAKVLLKARNSDVLILCTCGAEAFLVAAFRRLLPSSCLLVCADLLIPRESRLTRFAWRQLAKVDAFICIRTADIATLHTHFGIPSTRCHFLHFPVSCGSVPIATADRGYVYSAGWAHRDWPTLVQALLSLPYKAVLSAGQVRLPAMSSPRIEVLEQCSPDQGRALMAGSRLVALSFEDTHLPSGPLVLLDAMAMGKPIVATDVNGTRDYVDNGRTGILVPPAQPDAMAHAIHHLMENPSLRRSLGNAAYEEAAKLTAAAFLTGIIEVSEKSMVQGKKG